MLAPTWEIQVPSRRAVGEASPCLAEGCPATPEDNGLRGCLDELLLAGVPPGG